MTAIAGVRTRTIELGPALAVAVAAVAWLVFLFFARLYDAHRPDFYYLADAFLHGRTWLDTRPGAFDVIVAGDRFFVPFGPFPAILLAPLVAVVGPETAASFGPGVDALLASTTVGLGWWLAARAGVARPTDRLLLTVLLGVSTPILWITTRGGVWHTGQLVATALTMAVLVESLGARRPALLGLLVGAAFLSRAPLALALPFVAWVAARDRTDLAVLARAAIPAAAGFAPSLVFFLWYNAARFGSPLESGYALATVPAFLEVNRAGGLFSLGHVPMNLDYLFVHLPRRVNAFPFFQPDGKGLSFFLTSPGFLVAALADWGSPLVRALGLTTLLVLAPSLLYYGGGWFQYGYRYALDAMPFLFAVVALAVARRGLGIGGRLLIGLGVLVNVAGLYWAYRM